MRMKSLVCSMSTFPDLIRYRVLPLAFLGFFFLVVPAFSQGGGSAAQADLDQLVQSAENIVRGQVISATIEPHPQFPNLQTVLVFFSVSKALKVSALSLHAAREF